MRRDLLALFALAGCGRWGFGEVPSDARGPIVDGVVSSDGSVAVDGAPTDAARNLCFALFDGDGFDDDVVIGSDLLVGFRLTAPAAWTVTRLEVFTGERVGTNTLGLWSHDSGPNAPLADLGTASFEMSATNGWQGVDLMAPIEVPTGAVVWLMWGARSGAQASIDAPSALPPEPLYRGSNDGGQTWGNAFQLQRWKLRVWCDG